MKYIATALITDPIAVKARCTSRGTVFHNGSIWCSIPEIGMQGTNLMYCRYGLSIPYMRIQDGWKVLVEPTFNGDQRFFYTGISDCGGDITPDTNMQLLIKLLSQVIYATTTGTMHLSDQGADEPFVKGLPLQEWAESVDSAIKKLLDWSKTGIAPSGGSNDLGGISPLVTVPTDYTEFDSSTLSEKIFGE
jgi:hypothetical protein